MNINNLGHMTKMAAIPIYDKNPSKNSRTAGIGIHQISDEPPYCLLEPGT